MSTVKSQLAQYVQRQSSTREAVGSTPPKGKAF